jgi:serpin B
MTVDAGVEVGGSSACRRAGALISVLFFMSFAVLGNVECASADKGPSAKEGAHSDAAPNPAGATAAFGLDLIDAQAPGNVILSPNSIATALAMAGTGATGLTATQIAQTLHLSGPAAFDSVGKLQRTIAREQASAGEGVDGAATLEAANGLFLQRGFRVRQSFLGGLQQNFGVAPETVDFADLPGSLETINSWVSDHTGGVIPKLFDSLSRDTRLVLANAIYLRASWEHGFSPEMTSSEPFYTPSKTSSADFMHQTTRLAYGSGPGYRAVALPYKGSTLSMLVVLPAGRQLGRLQRDLSAGGLAQVVAGLSREEVKLSLPHFHIHTQANLDATLQSLGMTRAFSEAAQFSKITPGNALKIDTVQHVADIRVDETGTVAAAATGVVGVVKSISRGPVEFNANRPFLFFVRDDRTGAVLFAGRLTDPLSAGGWP